MLSLGKSSKLFAISLLLTPKPSSNSYNTVLSYRGSKWEVDTFEKVPEAQHPQITPEEVLVAEKVVRNDPVVQKLAAEVGQHSHLSIYRHINLYLFL